MTSLGSLGKQKQSVDLDFDWFGHSIRVNPIASDLVEIDFITQAGNIDLGDFDLSTEVTPEVMAKMGAAARLATDASVGSVKRLIHPDDWDTFWSAAIANGQDLADLLEVQKVITVAVTEARSGFPTGQPSASSDGLTPTPVSSADGSSSPVVATSSLPDGRNARDADQALRMLRGRPDLQEFVVMAEELDQRKAAGLTL